MDSDARRDAVKGGGPEDGRLRGWQAIASYLGRDVRSAQRYERTRGLPVHRDDAGGRAGPPFVYALRGELDEWLRGCKSGSEAASAQESGRPPVLALPASVAVTPAARRRALGLALGVLLLLIVLVMIGAAFLANGNGRPESVVLEQERFLVARGADGKVLWQKDVSPRTALLAVDEAVPPLLADLDNDSRDEVVFAYRTGGEDPQDKDRLLCFSGKGGELWTYRPGGTLVLGGTAVPDAYFIKAASASGRRADGTRFVVVVANHRVLGASQVTVLDFGGRRIGEYWHAGWIFDTLILDCDRDGVDEIALVGVDEPAGKAFLATIAAETPRSISPVPDGYAPGMARHKELAYLYFPTARTDTFFRRAVRAVRIYKHRFPDGLTVEVQQEGNPDILERTYLLDCRLQVLQLMFSDEFLLQGQRLEEMERLPHSWKAAELARLRQLENGDAPLFSGGK
jgi:hypothetical protein